MKFSSRVFLGVASAAVLIASLQGAKGQTVYYQSGTTVLTTNTISTYTALAGPSSNPPLVTMADGVTLTIGTGSAPAFLLVGYDGTSSGFGNAGDFSMTSGTIIAMGSEGAAYPGTAISIGVANAIGSFTISGGTIDLSTNASATKTVTLGVGTGANGDGTLTQTGGAITLGTHFAIGTGTGAEGSYSITGGSLSGFVSGFSGFLYVGDDGGDGTMNIGGTANVSIGGNAGVYVGGDLAGAGSTSGVIQQTGGTFTFQGAGIYLGGNADSSGSYELNGGTLEIGGNRLLSSQGASSFVLGGGTLKVIDSNFTSNVATTLTASTTSVIDTNGFTARFSSGFQGSGNVTKRGLGTLTVQGASTIGTLVLEEGNATFTSTLAADSLTVQDGTRLTLETTGNTATDSVTVDEGGELVGAINASGETTISGSQDLKRFYQTSSDYTLEGTLRLDIGGGSYSTAHLTAGSVTLADDAQIVLYTTGSVPVLNTVIAIFDTPTLSLGNNVTFVGVGALDDYTFDFDDETGAVTVVPEPSTIALLVLTGAVAFAFRRRLRAA